MIKKILIFFLLLFSINSTFAGLKGTTGGEENEINKPISSAKRDIIAQKNGLERIFCDKSLLYKGLEGVTENPRYTTHKKNKKVIETYANIYGNDFRQKKENIKKYGKEEIIKDYKGKVISRKKIITIPDLYLANINSSLYKDFEKECLNFRKGKREQSEEIDSLYIQVDFFSKYYNSYPKDLRKGILPSFFLKMFEVTDIIAFYLIWITFFNIIAHLILYAMSGDDKKLLRGKSLKNSFIYFFLIWLIKLGLFGAIMGIIGYQGLDFVKIIFNI